MWCDNENSVQEIARCSSDSVKEGCLGMLLKLHSDTLVSNDSVFCVSRGE